MGHGGKREGAGRKRKPLPSGMVDKALDVVRAALDEGKQWAAQEVIKREFPVPKPVLPEGCAEHDLILAKIKECTELAEKLERLEARLDEMEGKK